MYIERNLNNRIKVFRIYVYKTSYEIFGLVATSWSGLQQTKEGKDLILWRGTNSFITLSYKIATKNTIQLYLRAKEALKYDWTRAYFIPKVCYMQRLCNYTYIKFFRVYFIMK